MAGYGSVIYQSLDTKHCDICLLLEEDSIMVLVVYIYIYIYKYLVNIFFLFWLRIPTIAWCAVGNLWAPQFLSCFFDLGTVF